MDLNEVKKPEAIKLYTTQEVAVFIGVPYMTVYRMVKNGRIKAVNIAPPGSKKSIFRFRAEDVQAYFDSIYAPLPNTPRGPESVDE